MNQESVKKTFGRVNALANQVGRLKAKRDKIAAQLEDTEAKLADLELEWNDVQKEISIAVFGDLGMTGTVTMTTASDPTPTESRIKKKRKSKQVSTLAKSSQHAREKILARAQKRDEDVFRVIKELVPKGSAHFQAIADSDKILGTDSQIRNSLKRLRDQKRIRVIGKGRGARYVPVCKKSAAKGKR